MMGKERKKVKSKPVPIVEPKKREKPKPELNPIVEPIVEPKKPRAKTSDDIYVKLAVVGCTNDERIKVSDGVQKGELKLAYYTTENDKGYHYYLKIIKWY